MSSLSTLPSFSKMFPFIFDNHYLTNNLFSIVFCKDFAVNILFVANPDLLYQVGTGLIRELLRSLISRMRSRSLAKKTNALTLALTSEKKERAHYQKSGALFCSSVPIIQ